MTKPPGACRIPTCTERAVTMARGGPYARLCAEHREQVGREQGAKIAAALARKHGTEGRVADFYAAQRDTDVISPGASTPPAGDITPAPGEGTAGATQDTVLELLAAAHHLDTARRSYVRARKRFDAAVEAVTQ